MVIFEVCAYLQRSHIDCFKVPFTLRNTALIKEFDYNKEFIF